MKGMGGDGVKGMGGGEGVKGLGGGEGAVGRRLGGGGRGWEDFVGIKLRHVRAKCLPNTLKEREGLSILWHELRMIIDTN